MTATAILDTLAKEFSTRPEHVSSVLEMLDAGLTAPYIGRVRRSETGNITESLVRRLDRRRRELAELDRRRATIVRLLEAADGSNERALDEIRKCMDRFELEDLFIPHRRPEPEVQLALDRGLGVLADRFVEPCPKTKAASEAAASKADDSAAGDAPAAKSGDDAGAAAAPADPGSAEGEPEESGPVADAPSTTEVEAAEAPDAATATDAEQAPEATPSEADDPASAGAPQPEAPTEVTSGATPEAAGGEPEPEAAQSRQKPSPTPDVHTEGAHGRVELSPQVIRLCTEAVSPDRGVHTEEEALAGAMRVLSDRLGRDPRLRGALRRMMRKHGVLTVRATVEESKLGRHRSLLKKRQPLRQIQGHRLLAIRQAQKERVLTTSIELDNSKALPKVRAALGKHTYPEYEGVLDAVARQALDQRLVPMLEEDVRLELKERADVEALRFLAQHLRQILLAPYGGHRPVAGVDVNAKGDWTVVVLDNDGNPVTSELRVEVGAKRAADLGLELSKTLGDTGVRLLAVGHGKHARDAVMRLRQAISALGGEALVYIVNEAGLSSYANSELARQELPELSVPGRMAVSLARRFQDPLMEILKVDPRHLGLGVEQGLVSKASLRRTLRETVESCVAHIGCDVNRASLTFLKHVPGLSAEAAKKVFDRRLETPFGSRDELRAEGLLNESEWASAIAFLRVYRSSEPLDRTSLHPDQYRDARRIIEACGGSVEEVLGRRGATKGMRRVDFDIEEDTWRDMMREISTPGRDPRLRLAEPKMLDPATKPEDLQKGQEVEGILSNVASFGAFVDIGIGKEGMIHISEISDRYVRDARELLSVGQVVRARVLDPSGQRVALSIKGVGDPFLRGLRGPRPERPQQRGHSRARGRDERPSEAWPKTSSKVRAAQSRRDGMAGAGGPARGRKGGGGGGRPGGGGGGRGGPRHGGGRGRDRDERVDPKVLAQSSKKPNYNPFASFFRSSDEPSEDAAPKKQPQAETKPVEATKPVEPTKTPPADVAQEAQVPVGTPSAPSTAEAAPPESSAPAPESAPEATPRTAGVDDPPVDATE